MTSADVVAALNRLTTELEQIFERHPGCEDSDVRDRICEVLQSLLIEGNAKPKIPLFLGVFHPIVHSKIKRALHRFVANKEVQEFVQQTGSKARIETLKKALQEDQIVSESGTPMTEVLGEWA
ncbi:MAG TPA: hypothetical protein PKY51_12300 [Fimbriimonadaceae bacterium]|nr:hypothetical protein [Fimbriimonadaceae bacterium]